MIKFSLKGCSHVQESYSNCFHVATWKRQKVDATLFLRTFPLLRQISSWLVLTSFCFILFFA